MSTSKHSNLTGSELHVVHSWEFADQATRLNASGFLLEDEGKVAWQKSDNTFWVLVDYNATSWKEL